jgi:hypothetical protein
MKMLFIAFVLIAFITPNDALTGRWESKPSDKGNVTGVVFKQDSVMEAYVNRKSFASGIYHFSEKDSVLTFTDNGCNGAKGIYKILLFSNGDSMRFKAIYDSCTERKQGIQRLVLGRVNK